MNQNEDLEKETVELQSEIRHLRQENERLREKVSELEATMSERVAESVKEAVKQATAPLLEELSKARIKIAKLNAIVKKDSTNSSKPPSTNGLKNKGVPNSREKSVKGQGGQKGHKGSRLKLPENMEELEKQGILERRVEDHTNGSSEYVSRFTIDLELKVIVTEHRFAKGAPLPENLYRVCL